VIFIGKLSGKIGTRGFPDQHLYLSLKNS